MSSAPFADMSPPSSYIAFYLSNLLKLEDIFLSNCTLLNKEKSSAQQEKPTKVR